VLELQILVVVVVVLLKKMEIITENQVVQE
jgi:hypothetical protein